MGRLKNRLIILKYKDGKKVYGSLHIHPQMAKNIIGDMQNGTLEVCCLILYRMKQ